MTSSICCCLNRLKLDASSVRVSLRSPDGDEPGEPGYAAGIRAPRGDLYGPHPHQRHQWRMRSSGPTSSSPRRYLEPELFPASSRCSRRVRTIGSRSSRSSQSLTSAARRLSMSMPQVSLQVLRGDGYAELQRERCPPDVLSKTFWSLATFASARNSVAAAASLRSKPKPRSLISWSSRQLPRGWLRCSWRRACVRKSARRASVSRTA